jgi:predicted RNase H-like HicB family nuclease
MDATYTFRVREGDSWWIGWVDERPGVNSQGATRAELIENLASALTEALVIDDEPRIGLPGV